VEQATWTASLRHVVGFPHLGLLRRLRQLAGHRGRTPLASRASLPSFTCWTQAYGGGCRSQSLPLHAASWRTCHELAAHCSWLHRWRAT